MSWWFIHTVACVRISFSRLNYISLCEFIMLCLFTHQWTLGLLYLLVIVNIAAMNVSVQNLFTCLLSLLLSIYTEVELLDHMVAVCFVMWTWLKIISQSFCRVSFNLDLDSDYMFWLECHRCFFLFESYSTRWQVMFIWFLVFLTLIHFIVLLTARWIYCKIIIKSLCNY